MSISSHFIHRPVATSVLMAMIIAVGAAAYPFLPIAAVPQVDFPTVQVNANLPGASPETMASAVAQPLERQFSQIPGVVQMTSNSVMGSTQITLQFELDRALDGAAQDVQSAINVAAGQLPKTMPSPPNYQKVNPSDAPIGGYGFYSDVMPLTEVDDMAENLVLQQLSQLPGVGEVRVSGQQKPAIRIQVDPIKLAAVGLSLEEVRSIVNTASTNSPKGNIEIGAKGYTIFTNDQLTEAEPFNDVVLAFRNGSQVRVRDIGRAIPGAENTKTGAWNFAGKPMIGSTVRKQPGANIVETGDLVDRALERAAKLLPASIHIYRYIDRMQTIKAAVAEVKETLIITAVLVVLVIFVFLRNVRATVIPALAIPLSLIGTFAGMYLFNYSIDNLSLMALTIAVGFVVDDAIVMLENIYRHIEEGMAALAASLQGAREIGFTIVSMSLSLVAVFIPLLLMGGIIGRLFHEFAVTVSIAILISGVISLTITPMLCSKFLRHESGEHSALYRRIEAGFEAMFAFYRRTLDIALAEQRKVLGVFVATVALSGALYVLVPKGFFPNQDVGSISIVTEGAQDISFAELARLHDQAREILVHDPAVKTVGGQVPYGNAVNTGRLYALLKPHREREPVEEVMNRLRPQFAKIAGLKVFLSVSQDINIGARQTRTQYQYTLQDADANELSLWGEKMTAAMAALPELRDVTSDQQSGATTATLTIDRDQASRYGIQPQLIDDTLYDAFGQRQVGQYFTQVNTYRIILEVLPELQGDMRTLDKIFIKSPSSGQQVPLSTFVKVDTKKVSALSINHQGQFPAITISFNLAPGVALSQAVDAIQKLRESLGAPSSLNENFQGTAKAFQDSLVTQPYLVAAAILSVYAILAMLYESYIYPLAILSTLPSAGVGALLILLVAHYDLSVIALVGVLLLIGLVKKNGIMMVDFAVNAQRHRGAKPFDAIREACHLRFRPIMMTSAAALLGGLPLMFSVGAGSELRRPLGYAMVGGLLVSQALTLYTTPVVYLYLERMREWWRTRREAAHTIPQQAPAE
ncbi:MAG: efflux RND transporter permease subunit [Rhodospirillaceae bacterium]|nr:efflux RND transporter permease subunit [Rhodospirillaceae bacterium]